LAHSFEKDENGNYRPAAIRLTTARYYTPSGVSIDKVGVTPDIAVELPKGHEGELLKHGLYGDPPMEEEEVTTTPSRFTWKSNPLETTAPAGSTPAPSDDELNNEGSLQGSAVKSKDEQTTLPEPKKIIPLDRKLFPDAEVEGEAKKEEKKPKKNGQFVDYQLEVARRLLLDYIEKGKDFFAPDSGMPPAVASGQDQATSQAVSLAQ